jgi:hypothetical protein
MGDWERLHTDNGVGRFHLCHFCKSGSRAESFVKDVDLVGLATKQGPGSSSVMGDMRGHGRKGGWRTKERGESWMHRTKTNRLGKKKSASTGEIRNQMTTIIAGVGTSFHSSIYATILQRNPFVYTGRPRCIRRNLHLESIHPGR